LFLFSFLFGTVGGVIGHLIRRIGYRAEVNREHVLRSIFEVLETRQCAPVQRGLLRSEEFSLEELAKLRSWSRGHLRKVTAQLARQDCLVVHGDGRFTLTASGIRAAIAATRKHRMFEFYLQHQAAISEAGLDRTADFVEHVFDDGMLAELERVFASELAPFDVPKSAHPIESLVATAGTKRTEEP
jgi:manganese/zinc/iron transport system permease protein